MSKQLLIFDILAEKITSPESFYLYIDEELTMNLFITTCISLKRNTPLKIHSLGFQPAKLIPEIPRWFLQKYGSLPFTILEPFAGSGTTLTAAFMFSEL